LHPLLFPKKERRLNLILFFNKNWKEEYNGGLELWEPNMSKCSQIIYPKFNTGVIFRTNNNSWHGLSKKIACPEGEFRQTLAFYWVSDLTTKKREDLYRKKAKFVPVPGDPNGDKMRELGEIRVKRRITEEDMNKIWPGWNENTDYV
jgi:hypothetical protein